MTGFIKICEAGDYKKAYRQHVEFEMSFVDSNGKPAYKKSDMISYAKFVKEIKKGYGNSEYLQIARLLETDDGIYYDNEYVA